MLKNTVSIIIPIYNVEKYLPKCLDSLINQTFKNIEIICVNDGTLDKSGKICDTYAKKDNRIKVFHKKNGGVSDARNYGFKKSKGEFIYFLDGDDYLSPDYIENLANAIKDNDADLAYNEHFMNVYENKQIMSSNKSHWKNGVHEITEKDWHKIRSSACYKCYRKSFLTKTGVKFTKNLRLEDHLFSSMLIPHIKKIAITNKGIYYYVKHASSFSNTHNKKQKKKEKFDEIEVYKNIYKYYKKLNILHKAESFYWLLKWFFRIEDINKQSYFNQLKKLFNSFDKKFLSSRSKRELEFYNIVKNQDLDKLIKHYQQKHKIKNLIKKFRLLLKR